MLKDAMRRIWTILLASTVCVPVLAAQCASINTSSPPLELSNIRVSGRSISATLTNRHSKDIAAYVIAVEFFADSKRVQYFTSTTVARGTPSGRRYHPGMSWQEDIGMIPARADGNPIGEPKVSVDYVLFEDCTRWGPDAYNRSVYIAGVRDGERQERAKLRRLLQDRGAQAVAADLEAQ